VLLFSFSSFIDAGVTVTAFKGMYVQDGLALFFKRFFLVAAIMVLLMSVEFADRFRRDFGILRANSFALSWYDVCGFGQ